MKEELNYELYLKHISVLYLKKIRNFIVLVWSLYSNASYAQLCLEPIRPLVHIKEPNLPLILYFYFNQNLCVLI